jgi:hypothetical protein
MWLEKHLHRYWFGYYFPPVVWYFFIAGNVILGQNRGISNWFALISLAGLVIMGLIIPRFILQLLAKIELLEEEGRVYLRLLRKLERKGIIEGDGMGGFTVS